MLNDWSRIEIPNLQFSKHDIEPAIDTTKPLPQSFDWRDEHVVTEVKNQGICGSCWAFASIATIESAYAIKYNLKDKDLIELSEQEMIDCITGYPYHSRGCDGGSPLDVYEYATQLGVIEEKNYPYRNKNNTSVCSLLIR